MDRRTHERKCHSGFLDYRDMGGPRAHCTGRNNDRRREALSPRGVLYAWAWSEMARKARPGPRFQPSVSRQFPGAPSPLCGFGCLADCLENDCARVRPARTHRAAKAAVRRSGHDRKLPLRPSVVDRLRSGLIPPRQLPDHVARIFLAEPVPEPHRSRLCSRPSIQPAASGPAARRDPSCSMRT